jgi:hypothetical protein
MLLSCILKSRTETGACFEIHLSDSHSNSERNGS